MLGALGVVLLAAAVPLAALAHQLTVGGLAFHVILLPFGIVGFVVARRVPRNPIGWILLVVALAMWFTGDDEFYAVRAIGSATRACRSRGSRFFCGRLDLDARPDAAADRAVPRRPPSFAAVALDDVASTLGRAACSSSASTGAAHASSSRTASRSTPRAS